MKTYAEEAIERVDLAEKILKAKETGFPVSPEDNQRAKDLGLDLKAMNELLGGLYDVEADEDEDTDPI